MPSARNTNTPIHSDANTSSTKTHLSTNILIKVEGNIVGAIKTMDVNESRSIKMIDEVGTDGSIDSAPQSSTKITGSCQRTRFGKKRIAEAFNRGFIHVHSQRVPFDIEIHDIFADSNMGNAVITTIQNVWISDIKYTYSADDFIIVDNMSWQAERIFSKLAKGNVVTSVSNGTGSPIHINQFEQEADSGEYTGALDAAGLINDFLSS